jgi:dihydroflavonol-4-reductase
VEITRALVTGATGHIGSMLCRALIERDVDVVALARPSSDRKAIEGMRLHVVEGDVLQPATMTAARGCDLIFHNAATFAMHTPNPGALIDESVRGAVNVIAAAAHHQVKRVVLTSSVVAVGFADRPDVLLDEQSWASGLTVPYYVAKLLAEQAAERAANEASVDLVRVLPTLVLGPGDHRITPSSRLLFDMLAGRGVTFEGGLNAIDVRDVTCAMIAAAERGRRGARYILGGENILFRDFGALVSELTGNRIRHIGLPRWAMSTMAGVMETSAALFGREPAVTRAIVRDAYRKYGWYDLSRARTELGLTARPLAETVRDAAEFFVGRSMLPQLAVAELRC